ncbi:MAG: hypothetical protein P9M06_07215 [Candidatus Saelkia tenebricola]|nr:hypothetical protein [Candidatus Saelkia tenebricola]
MKIFKLSQISLLFCLTFFLLSPSPSYARRLKENLVDPISRTPYSTLVSSEEYLSAERKVADIFEDVVLNMPETSSTGYELSLKTSILRGLAGLLVLKIPNAETLIRDTISRVLKEETQLIQSSESVGDYYEKFFSWPYKTVKTAFEERLDFDDTGFMDYESFLACMRITKGPRGGGLIWLGQALSFYPVAAIYQPSRPAGIVYTAYKLMSNGFLNPVLEERVAWAAGLGVYGRPLISKLAESIGSEEKLFKAYMLGSFEPLRGSLSDPVIECLELLEAYAALMFTLSSDLGSEVHRIAEKRIEHFTKAIILNNDEASQLRNSILREISALGQGTAVYLPFLGVELPE